MCWNVISARKIYLSVKMSLCTAESQPSRPFDLTVISPWAPMILMWSQCEVTASEKDKLTAHSLCAQTVNLQETLILWSQCEFTVHSCCVLTIWDHCDIIVKNSHSVGLVWVHCDLNFSYMGQLYHKHHVEVHILFPSRKYFKNSVSLLFCIMCDC